MAVLRRYTSPAGPDAARSAKKTSEPGRSSRPIARRYASIRSDDVLVPSSAASTRAVASRKKCTATARTRSSLLRASW